MCASLLIWLWPPAGKAPIEFAAETTDGKPATRDAIMAEASGVAQTPALPAELRAMLAALSEALAARSSRAGEAVLTFKDHAAMQRFLARAAAAGLNVLAQLGPLRSVRVRFNSASALEGELLENSGDYENLAANGLMGIPQPPAKENRADVDQIPFRNEALAFLGASGDRSTWGRGTLIAVIDTGVTGDATFGMGRLRSLDIGLGSAPGAGADDGHGTAIAALAAGTAADAPGVSPAAELLSIRVTDASGLSDLFTVSRAIVAAVDAGAKIVNVSLGGYSTATVLDAAITYATQKGAVIVAAAGNDQAAQLAWPAADPRVISVGAIDKAEQQVSFSNSGAQLQLTAPGYGVQSAWLDGRRVYVDGTSASAPIVAGAIAAVVSQNPNLTPQQAADLLARTANDAGAPGTDASYGHGIINLATAMNRGQASYVDTAVSSHYFDAANNRMDFVVQNRSGRTITGMSLSVTIGTTTSNQSVPSLAAGETYVAKVSVNESALKTAGSLTYSTQLVNPIGTVDQVPANNKRSSTLSLPKP